MLQTFVFQKILNFTYALTKPPDGQWGSIQPDMSWTGIVGMLTRGEIDIGKLKNIECIYLSITCQKPIINSSCK